MLFLETMLFLYFPSFKNAGIYRSIINMGKVNYLDKAK